MKIFPGVIFLSALLILCLKPVFSEEMVAPEQQAPAAAAEAPAESVPESPENPSLENPVPAQPPVVAAQEKTVGGVYITGNKAVSSSLILSKVKSKQGEAYKKATVDEDIKRIYGLGYFSDVKAEVKEFENSLDITFAVTEKPPIGQIIFAGNKTFRDERLKKELKIKQDEILDERQLKESTKVIREMYYKKGFTHAKVDYAIRLDPVTNKAVVTILIDEDKRVKINRITFEGNKAFKSDQLTRLMSTKTAWWFFRSGTFNEDAFESDLEKIKAFYENNGYLDIKLEPDLKYNEQGGSLWINIKVDEGKKYLVNTLAITGQAVIAEKDLRKPLKMTVGKAFSQEAMRADADAMQGLYFEKGYIYATIKPESSLNPETNNIDVKYTIIENELTFVGRVEIKGNVRTKDKVIRRELRLRPGQAFDGKKLQRSKERLYNLGYFEDITFDTEKSTEPNKANLIVDVKETKTGEFSFGGGFSTVDKLVGFIQVTQRNFDLFNFPTFTGGGQQLAVRAEIGTVRRDYQLSFTEPWVFDYPYLFGFDLYQNTHLKAADIGYGYSEQRQGGDLRLGKEFDDNDRADMIYRLESVKISDVDSTALADLQKEQGTNVISSLTLGLTRDLRDSTLSPTKGYILFGSVQGAGGPIGGDKNFVKYYGSSSFYFSFIERQVLQLTARAGAVGAFGNTDSVPIYERFFIGGADTVRGYKERSIGPKDPVTNSPLGGNAMLVGNAEYVFPIVEFLKGAVFMDAGNVWQREGDFGKGGVMYSAGTGIRVKTPVGPIKLDYGYPLKTDQGEKKVGRFHFSLSRAF
ncbi:MAG: outer membrane protein assembly factor BamA [Candidatus Omnitrophota bacterium]